MTRRGLAAVVLTLAACGGGRPTAPVGPSAPLVPVRTDVGAAIAASATLTIPDPDTSGTLQATDGGLTLWAPAGAVTTATVLSVTPIENLARGGLGAAYRLGPQGARFAAPVTLTFRAPASYPLGMTIAGVGVEYQDAAGFWRRVEPVARDPSAGTVSVTTTHLSDWALTWQGGAAAAEGPISLVQTVAPAFTAAGRATVYFQADDADDTSYAFTGTLTLQAPLVFDVEGGVTCAADPRTRTLSVNAAEAHKSTPPVFRFGIGGQWTLGCSDGSTRTLPALFDTMGILSSLNGTRCSGSYAAGQVVTAAELSGSYTTSCGAEGSITASWSLLACAPSQACSTGVECEQGLTACTGGVSACVYSGPVLDPVPCGPAAAGTCSGGVCVMP